MSNGEEARAREAFPSLSFERQRSIALAREEPVLSSVSGAFSDLFDCSAPPETRSCITRAQGLIKNEGQEPPICSSNDTLRKSSIECFLRSLSRLPPLSLPLSKQKTNSSPRPAGPGNGVRDEFLHGRCARDQDVARELRVFGFFFFQFFSTPIALEKTRPPLSLTSKKKKKLCSRSS